MECMQHYCGTNVYITLHGQNVKNVMSMRMLCRHLARSVVIGYKLTFDSFIIALVMAFINWFGDYDLVSGLEFDMRD